MKFLIVLNNICLFLLSLIFIFTSYLYLETGQLDVDTFKYVKNLILSIVAIYFFTRMLLQVELYKK